MLGIINNADNVWMWSNCNAIIITIAPQPHVISIIDT